MPDLDKRVAVVTGASTGMSTKQPIPGLALSNALRPKKGATSPLRLKTVGFRTDVPLPQSAFLLSL